MTKDNDMQNRCRAMEFATRHDKDVRYLEQRIVDLEKLMEVRFKAQQQAVETANVAMAARFESVNEFRAAMGDQAQKFITREVVSAKLKDVTRRIGVLSDNLSDDISDLSDDISDLENRMASYDGRIVGWSAGVGFVVLVISIVAQLVNLGG